VLTWLRNCSYGGQRSPGPGVNRLTIELIVFHSLQRPVITISFRDQRHSPVMSCLHCSVMSHRQVIMRRDDIPPPIVADLRPCADRSVVHTALAACSCLYHSWFRHWDRQTDGLVGLEFNAPLDTIWVFSEAVFTANHLTDTDKQNSTGKYRRMDRSPLRGAGHNKPALSTHDVTNCSNFCRSHNN